MSNKVSSHINPGELVAVLGNKSVRNEFLKTLAGRQFEADSGQIMLQGLERSKEERMKFVSYFDTNEHLINTQTVNRSLMIASKMQDSTNAKS